MRSPGFTTCSCILKEGRVQFPGLVKKIKKVILGVVGVRVPVADLVEERVGDLVRPGEQLAVGQVDRELPVRVQDRRRGSLVGGLEKSKSEIQYVPIFTF